jgi:hypothetical protein
MNKDNNFKDRVKPLLKKGTKTNSEKISNQDETIMICLEKILELEHRIKKLEDRGNK